MDESCKFSLTLRMLNGKLFDFENPQLAEYDIALVATVLGKKCRFGDHIKRHYSVAEHCCHAHDLYPRNRLGALMHDSPEFILDDVITPIKRRIQGYKELEHSVGRDMEKRFGFVMPDATTFKLIDDLLFHQEETYLYDNVKQVYDIKVPIKCWSPTRAANEFLARYDSARDSALQQFQAAG